MLDHLRWLLVGVLLVVIVLAMAWLLTGQPQQWDCPGQVAC